MTETSDIIELDRVVTTSRYAEYVTARIETDADELRIGGSTNMRVVLDAPNGPPPLSAWFRLHFAADLTVASLSTTWQCSPLDVVDASREIICIVPADRTGVAISEGAEFSVLAGVRSGLHGIAVEAGFGAPPATAGDWLDMTARPDASRTMMSVLSPLQRAPVRPKGQREVAVYEHLPRTANTSSKGQNITRYVPYHRTIPSSETAHVIANAASLVTFCALYTALSVSNSSVVAGPVTFSALNSSSNSGETCSDSSTITLTSASITLGGVTFSDVNGMITPTAITLNTRVDSGRVGLTITGPFPDTGSLFTATATFNIGSAPVVLNGSLDYSKSNAVTISLGLTASNIGWAPLPNFSVTSGGVRGTFTRSGSGASAVDEFDVRMTFGGNWNPIGSVAITSVTADVNNSSGDLVVSLSATAAGGISLAGLAVSVDGLSVTGVVDTTTGVTALDVALGALNIDSIINISPASAKFSYDPRTGGISGTTVLISGNAGFAGGLGSFFSGATATATIEFSSAGFIVSAAMTSGPPTPGFGLTSLQFVYASLVTPTVPLSYQPTYPGASGILIPLANKTPLAIATTKGLPATFVSALTSLRINIVDPNALGVLAIQLPPAVPTFSVYYGAPSQPFLIGNASSSTFVRFDDIFLTIQAGENSSFSIGGDVTMQVSGATLQLRSGLTVATTATGGSLDGFLELIDTTGWANAFGISGLTVFDLLVQAGVADGLPSFGIEATASLPPAMTAPLGIVNGSVITLGLNLSATAPCAIFSISAPPTSPQANVIYLNNGGLTATSANVVIAPEGCEFGTTSYSGFALEFTGAIRGVNVGFNTTFTLEPSFVLQGSGYVGTFPLGAVQMQQTTVNLSISDAGFSLTLEGGFTAGTALTATGKALLSSNGGFTFDGSGTLRVGTTSADVTVHATDCKDAACTTLTTPSFNASGDVTIQGFDFSASVAVSSDGTYRATLSIASHTHDFSFDNKSPKVTGTGTLTYSMSVGVSNTGSDDLKFTATVKLNSCTVIIGLPFDCKGATVTWSSDIGNGQVTVSLRITDAGQTFTTKMTV